MPQIMPLATQQRMAESLERQGWITVPPERYVNRLSELYRRAQGAESVFDSADSSRERITRSVVAKEKVRAKESASVKPEPAPVPVTVKKGTLGEKILIELTKGPKTSVQLRTALNNKHLSGRISEVKRRGLAKEVGMDFKTEAMILEITPQGRRALAKLKESSDG